MGEERRTILSPINWAIRWVGLIVVRTDYFRPGSSVYMGSQFTLMTCRGFRLMTRYHEARQG